MAAVFVVHSRALGPHARRAQQVWSGVPAGPRHAPAAPVLPSLRRRRSGRLPLWQLASAAERRSIGRLSVRHGRQTERRYAERYDGSARGHVERGQVTPRLPIGTDARRPANGGVARPIGDVDANVAASIRRLVANSYVAG